MAVNAVETNLTITNNGTITGNDLHRAPAATSVGSSALATRPVATAASLSGGVGWFDTTRNLVTRTTPR